MAEKKSPVKDTFKDLKIIELASVLAGPSVGYFFAELGGKVIKIENPKTKGDVTRSWKLKTENPKEDTSAYFWSVNANKEFLFLDITVPSQFRRRCLLRHHLQWRRQSRRGRCHILSCFIYHYLGR